MSEKHNSPCKHISSSLRISPNGLVKPCCTYDGAIARLDSISNLNEFWTSDQKLSTLKRNDLNGDWDPGCIGCRDLEKAGIISRKMLFDRISNRIGIRASDGNLRHMDIAFGNTCNLACVMCNGMFSSTWSKHESNLPPDVDWITPNKNWSMTTEQIDMLCDAMSDVEAVEILGGEPLYDKRFRYLLSRLDREDRLGEINFSLVTNFTVIDDDLASMLSRIKTLILTISIDGTGRYYEWIRGFDFKTVENNIKRYIPSIMGDNRSNLVVNCVVSCYNLENLIDYYRWLFSLTESTGVMFRPFLLLCAEPHMDPNLSKHRDIMLSKDIVVLEGMVSSNEIYPDQVKEDCLRDLSNLRTHLLNDAIRDDAETLRRNRIWHSHLVRMRGWDIWQDPLLLACPIENSM